MRGVISKLDEMPRPPSGGDFEKGAASFELQTYQNHAIVDCHGWPKSTEVKWVSAEGGWTEIALDVKTWLQKFHWIQNQSGAFRVGSILQRYPCHSMAVNCGHKTIRDELSLHSPARWRESSP
jgi:hypothetical protein